MNIKRIGKQNAVVITVGDLDVLVSYSTTVAYTNRKTGKSYKTAEFHSVTTSRHVNSFLDGQTAEEIPQADLDDLL